MKSSCTPSPSNKKECITNIGKILVTEHGKKNYYTPEEVKKAHKKSKCYDALSPDILDFSCWAMSIFSSHNDFDSYHESTGEIYDYAAMKSEMLQGLSASSDTHWTEIPDLDIDASWLDFGDAFEGIFEGIGEFIGGIFSIVDL